MKLFVIALLSFTTMFSSCGNTSKQTKELIIASYQVDCEGVALQKCLLIKEKTEDEWMYFYNDIEGFKYQEGYEYVVKVEVSNIKNPPADGSSLQYTLVKILSQEQVQSQNVSQYLSPVTQDTSIIAIEYIASTRGSFLSIKVNKDVIERTADRSLKDSKRTKCSKKDWSEITALVQDVALEKINALEAPSSKKNTDAALIAQIKVILPSHTFTSSQFDHGNPPEEIEQLVNTILSLAESIE